VVLGEEKLYLPANISSSPKYSKCSVCLACSAALSNRSHARTKNLEENTRRSKRVSLLSLDELRPAEVPQGKGKKLL
jgi:hypothetical protein